MEHYTFGLISHSTKRNGLTTSGNYSTREYRYSLLTQTGQINKHLLNTTTTLPMEITPTTAAVKAITANLNKATGQTLHLLANTIRGTAANNNSNTNTANHHHHPTITTITTISIMSATPSKILFEQWAWETMQLGER
jgi:hypothetical protein